MTSKQEFGIILESAVFSEKHGRFVFHTPKLTEEQPHEYFTSDKKTFGYTCETKEQIVQFFEQVDVCMYTNITIQPLPFTEKLVVDAQSLN